MAIHTLANPASVAYQIQTVFSKTLLDRIKLNLVLHQFGLQSPLPKNAGSKTMRMFRFNEPSVAGIVNLTEGTPISSFKEMTLEYVEVALTQIGQVISISDVLSATSLLDFMAQATEQNADDAALKCDTVISTELKTHTGSETGGLDYTNKNFLYSGTTTYALVRNSGTFSANFVCTAANLLDACTALKIKNAPRIGGYYIAAAAPQVTRDLMEADDVWQRVSSYSATDQIYQGEVGKLFGVRVLETTNPWRSEATEGTYAASGSVFSTFVFGKNAFGVPALSGESANRPQVYVVKGADKSDPLNQIAALVGFKTMYAAKLVQPKWLSHIYSQSGYGH